VVEGKHYRHEEKMSKEDIIIR